MKEKILYGVIGGLVLVLIGILVYISVTPTINSNNNLPVVENNFPANELPSVLNIAKPEKRIPRIFAIRNYPDKLITDELNLLPRLRFFVIDPDAQGHLLILPFETGGKIIVSKLMWDDYNEEYVQSNKVEDILIEEKITPGYGLLLKYDRPVSNPEILIKIIQGESTATYIVEPKGSMNEAKEFDAVQYIAEDQ